MPFSDTKDTFAVKDDTNDIFLKPSCQPKLQFQNLLLDRKLFACVGKCCPMILKLLLCKEARNKLGLVKRCLFSDLAAGEADTLNLDNVFKYPFCKNKLIFQLLFFQGWFNIFVCGVPF